MARHAGHGLARHLGAQVPSPTWARCRMGARAEQHATASCQPLARLPRWPSRSRCSWGVPSRHSHCRSVQPAWAARALLCCPGPSVAGMAGAPAPCLVCGTVSDAIMGAEAPAAAAVHLWGGLACKGNQQACVQPGFRCRCLRVWSRLLWMMPANLNHAARTMCSSSETFCLATVLAASSCPCDLAPMLNHGHDQSTRP